MNTTRWTSAFMLLLRRDLLLACRNRAEIANPLLFFILVAALFPLAAGPQPELLQKIASGVIWVAALLANLLSLDVLFRSDYEDGSLEQLLLSPHPTSLLVLSKITAHWITTGLPMVLVSPLLAGLLSIPASAYPTLLYTLMLGTPALSLIGAIGVALTVGLQRGGILLSLLVLPLYIPVLVFASDAIHSASIGMAPVAQLSLLASLLVLALSLSPTATAAALRISLS